MAYDEDHRMREFLSCILNKKSFTMYVALGMVGTLKGFLLFE